MVIGSVIGRLVVSDQDSGENAAITYSELRSGNQVLDEASFLAVNSTTGDIYTTG